jgi:dTMP kinase
MFISFEGIDGAGKSTQAQLLADALAEAAGPGSVLLLREPGGTPAGERIRELLKDPALELSPRAELLLFLAARAELVEAVIKPALAEGRTVICDRFMDSTVAYQGAARGLGVERVAGLNGVAVDGCVPDRTVLLRLDRGSAAARGEGRGDYGADRFEREDDGFKGAIADCFDELAAAEPARFCVIDGAGAPGEVHERVVAALGGLEALAAPEAAA